MSAGLPVSHTLPVRGGGWAHGRALDGPTRLKAYLVATVATVVLLLLRLSLGRFVSAASPFLLFAPAVIISAWYGGRGPGLLSTIACGAAANFFLLAPSGSFSNGPTDIVKTVIFLLVGGQISWFSGALFDAKRRAEMDAQAARRSEQLYRTLAQHFPNGAVFLLDNFMRVALAEGSALAAVRMSPEMIRGKRLAHVFPRPIRKALQPLMMRDQGGSMELTFEGRVYLLRILPLRGTAGQQFAGMGIALDITELADSRAQLQASHDELEMRVRERTAALQFQTALLEAQSDASLDGILVSTHDGKLIFRNRRLCDLWDLPPSAFAGSRDDAVHAMRTKLAGRQDPLGGGADLDAPRVELPAMLELRDGRALECYGAPVDGAAGESYGRAWYFRDITERRRTARQILEAGEAERQRIGQDLHDDLCQHLAGISCLGRVLEQRLAASSQADAKTMGEVVDLIEQAVHKARDIAKGLQPLQLETDDLPSALQALASNIENLFKIRCQVACSGDVSIRNHTCLMQLYRIAQEAITNAIRHGHATNVLVSLSNTGDGVTLRIADDGIGVETAAANSSNSGMGIKIMNHRARMIGADLTIESSSDTGTIVSCSVSSRLAENMSLTPNAFPTPAEQYHGA